MDPRCPIAIDPFEAPLDALQTAILRQNSRCLQVKLLISSGDDAEAIRELRLLQDKAERALALAVGMESQLLNRRPGVAREAIRLEMAR